MAVPEQTPYKEYDGNGVTKTFTLEFICESKDHLKVTINGVEPELSAWSFDANTNSVTFSVAPAADSKIVLQRDTPMSRTTNYQSTNNSMTPKTLNADIDRVWLKLQELGIADMLLKIYVDRLHGEQKDYIDNKDQLVRNIISDLRNYVNQQDGLLSSDIDNLRTHVDRQNNNQNSYFENLINQQGVSLQQLDSYYKHLLQGIANIAAEKGWLASLVVDANGKNQQEINNNTAYFYTTVAQMIADIKLTDGVIVGTKGYHNIFDDGGAVYLISATSTDYSIPLANGLHAVFRDTFNIRKFGIRDNATLDQTEELRRMVAYADTRVYEIDFHSFEVMTPKTWAWVETRGVLANTTTPINVNPSQVMGLSFNYCHRIKNLRITHDKTTRLNTSQNLINFLPLKNPSTEQWFELENVTFDPWVDNYQPWSENYLGNYDGMRHGFFCHPAVGSDIRRWAETATNISFKFKNIHFESPAYSYNLTPSAIHAKNIVVENLSGQYLGLYLNYTAKRIVGDTIRGIRRLDLKESERRLVGNLIHYEGEFTGRTAAYDLVELTNTSAFDSETGLPASVYVYHNVGTTSVKKFVLRNSVGHSRISGCSADEVLVENLTEYASFICLDMPRCDSLKLKNFTSSVNQGTYGSAPYLLHSAEFGEVELDNCKLPYALYLWSASTVVKVKKLIVKNTELPDSANGIARGETLRVDRFEATNIKPNSSTGRIIWCDIGSAVIDGVDYTEEGTTTNYLGTTIGNVNAEPADITLKNVDSKRNNISSDSQFLGAMNLTLINSVFNVRPRIPSTINLTESAVYPKIGGSKTFNPPSIPANGGATTTTVTATGIKLGDFVQASFTKYHEDIRIEAQVSADDTVTVKFTNTGSVPADLPSGTLAVVKV